MAVTKLERLRGAASNAADISQTAIYGCEVTGPRAFRDFIEACDPPTILALLDCVEALREGRDTNQFKEYPNRYPEDYRCRVDRLLAALDKEEPKP